MFNQLYPPVLALHNAWRWVALLGILFAAGLAFQGWLSRKPWTALSARSVSIGVIVMDVQLIIGLALYLGLSPLSRALFTDFTAAMQARETRFFGMEHSLLMVLAVGAVHFGKLSLRHQTRDGAKHRSIALWYGASLLLMLAGIPWWRPLLRH
ncbi:MAG TPA: hypothetical protein VGD78_05300 [Chthoniobacterales bacterium]